MATAAQIAHRKRFAEMVRSGAFKKRSKNPAKKSAAKKAPRRIKSLNQPSQATGKKPTKRLVARRKKTAAAPRGYYANPKKVAVLGNSSGFKHRVYQITATGRKLIAGFMSRADATAYAQAFADAKGVQMGIE